jgi:glycosyltransferase involved in cell wall biosynthesis
MTKVTFLIDQSNQFRMQSILDIIRGFSPEIVSQVLCPPEIPEDISFHKLENQLFSDARLRQAITRFDPDVIYSDRSIYGGQIKAQAFFKRMKKPLILRLRGDLWREYWATFSHERQFSKRLRGLLFRHSYLWASVAFASKVIPICRWLDKVLQAHVPYKNSEVVYEAVDPSRFFEEEGMEFRKPAVAIIQNHNIYPKVEGLLKFKKVISSLPDINFYIAEGQEQGSSFLQVVKAHYAGMGNVEFVSGVHSRSAVRRMLTACDCYVLASGLDCCPMSLLEASLMRRPVIASRVGGVPEIVLENQSGWTIDNDCVEDWVSRIRMVLSDSRLRRRIGEQGRIWVANNFSWQIVGPQFEDILLREASRN